jgi:hypothetical protein
MATISANNQYYNKIFKHKQYSKTSEQRNLLIKHRKTVADYEIMGIVELGSFP